MPDSGASVGSVQGTWVVLGGAAGVSDGFGTMVRFHLRLFTAFFGLCFFLAGRVGRFALAFARAVFLTRFARLVLVVRRFACPPLSESNQSCQGRESQGTGQVLLGAVIVCTIVSLVPAEANVAAPLHIRIQTARELSLTDNGWTKRIAVTYDSNVGTPNPSTCNVWQF